MTKSRHHDALRLDSVRKVYGTAGNTVTALDGVTLSLPSATFTAVMGPSGSGKSTLLQCALPVRVVSGASTTETELGRVVGELGARRVLAIAAASEEPLARRPVAPFADRLALCSPACARTSRWRWPCLVGTGAPADNREVDERGLFLSRGWSGAAEPSAHYRFRLEGAAP